MKINQRQSDIVQIVNEKVKVSVNELSDLLGVSEVTIRKDLEALDSYGILVRQHGFALKKNTASITNRLSINYDTKRIIAKKAASLVKPNETVLLGGGSTCVLVAEEIINTNPSATIITNSIYVVEHLAKIGCNKVVLLGGEYQPDAKVLVGPLVRNSCKQFYVDKMFIGTDGFVKGVGFMGSDSLRTEAIKNMAESAKNIIIVTDSSKFNHMGLLVQFQLNEVGLIITDNGLTEEYQDYFARYRVPIMMVE